jgi:hypothetical protein
MVLIVNGLLLGMTNVTSKILFKIFKSSFERQKGITTGNFCIQLDPFVSELIKCTATTFVH